MAKHDKAKRAARLTLNKLVGLLRRLGDEAHNAGDFTQARAFGVERYMAGVRFARLGVVVAPREYRTGAQASAVRASYLNREQNHE